MSGIYYALSIVALFVIIRWCLANDRVGPNEPTTGLLAMKDQPQTQESGSVVAQEQHSKRQDRDRERP